MLVNTTGHVVLHRKTTGKKTLGGNSDAVDQQEDMETTDCGNGIGQEHTENIATECETNTQGTKISHNKKVLLRDRKRRGYLPFCRGGG